MLLSRTSVIPRIDAGFGTLIAAGLLVGWAPATARAARADTAFAGCSRLSPRSLAATAAFMLAGIVTVFARHLV